MYFERCMATIKRHLVAVKGNKGNYNQIYLANAYNNMGAICAAVGPHVNWNLIFQAETKWKSVAI